MDVIISINNAIHTCDDGDGSEIGWSPIHQSDGHWARCIFPCDCEWTACCYSRKGGVHELNCCHIFNYRQENEEQHAQSQKHLDREQQRKETKQVTPWLPHPILSTFICSHRAAATSFNNWGLEEIHQMKAGGLAWRIPD